MMYLRVRIIAAAVAGTALLSACGSVAVPGFDPNEYEEIPREMEKVDGELAKTLHNLGNEINAGNVDAAQYERKIQAYITKTEQLGHDFATHEVNLIMQEAKGKAQEDNGATKPKKRNWPWGQKKTAPKK